MNDFTIILRSMAARRFSTVTTTITVAVAVGLLLTLLTIADSGREAFKRGSGNMHLLVSGDTSPLVAVLNGVFYAGAPARKIPHAKFLEIAAFGPSDVPPGVAPGFAIPLQSGDTYKGMPVVATTPEFFTRFAPVPGQPWALSQGEFFDADLEVVLGSRAAVDSGLRLGDLIVMTHGSSDSRGGHAGHSHDEFKFKVVGILKPTGSAHDRALFISLQSSWLMHAFDRLEAAGGVKHDHAEPADAHAGHDHAEAPIHPEDLLESDKNVTGIYLRVPTREGSDASSSMPAVASRLRTDPTITVADPGSEIKKLFTIVGALDKVLLGMALVVLVGSGISITIALYNSMEQRRRQIAILRVLGCSRGRVFGLVLTEAAILGMLGALAGLILSLAGGVLVSTVMMRSYGVQIAPQIPPDLALAVMLGTVLLAALAGLIPAVLAYRTPVANNLRPIG